MQNLTLHDSMAANEIKDEFGDRAEIVVIPNASHALIPEQPAAVTKAIVTWIGKLPKP
jgi:pimeloyl-ACP methyl ester carboxylesterase